MVYIILLGKEPNNLFLHLNENNSTFSKTHWRNCFKNAKNHKQCDFISLSHINYKLISYLYFAAESAFSEETSEMQQDSCDKEINLYSWHQQAFLSSPHYPHNYNNNVNCTVVITAPVGYNIMIQFSRFSLEDDYPEWVFHLSYYLFIFYYLNINGYVWL